MRTIVPCRQVPVGLARRLALASLLAASALPMLAQVAADTTAAAPASPPSETDQELITLSPFQVDSSTDRGYAATNTLAGSRLNARILDTPAAISVMTPEFLNDIGAVNIDTAIGFGANTEVNKNDDNGGYRIRGITSSVSRSRNLFLVSGDQIKASSDLYNVDRITTSRGPNAILYGNADPAGVIDVSTLKASLGRNQGRFSQQMDSYDGGKRASLDWNQVLIPGRLALRFDTMYQDVNGFRSNSPQRDKNIYVTGTAVLIKTEHYSLTASFDAEYDKGTFNYARVNQFNEQFSFYKASGSPTLGAYSTTLKPTYLPGTRALSSTTYPVFIGGASVRLPTMNWANAGVSNSATLLDPNINKSSTAANLAILDDSIFPLYTNLYGPNAGREDNTARYRTVSLTQKIGKDLYIETAFNDFLGHKWRPWSSGGFTTILMDPNGYLPNGAVNPNKGKYYIERNLQPQNYTFIDSTFRVGLAYELNLKKLNSWLGLHRFATSYDYRKTGRYIDNYNEVNLTPLASAAAAAQATAPNYLTNSQNFVYRRYYLDPANGILGADDISTPIDDNGVKTATLPVRPPTVTQNRSSSFSEALQSFWLKDHLVTTVGFRQDTADSYNVRAGSIQDSRGVYLPATSLLGSTPVAHYRVNTKSLGAVAHLTSNVSIFANKSDNFSPDVTRHNVFGEIIPPTVGKGKDFGFKFQFFDDKLSISLGRYQNSKENTVVVGTSVFGDDSFGAIWNALGVSASDSKFPGQGFQYNYTNSNESKGTELEITFNPTPNWRIRIVGDKNDTVFSSFAPEYDAYFAKYLPVWSAANQNLIGSYGSQSSVSIATSMQRIRDQQTLNHAQLASAMLVTPYAANIITSYRFPKGSVLRNFFVGGSQSYAAATIIGFPNLNTTDPTKPNYGLTMADTAHPYKGRDVYTTGVWLGYERSITHRKIKWRLQLNVNNALDDQKPIPFHARTQDGAIDTAQLRAPRQFVLQNSFAF